VDDEEMVAGMMTGMLSRLGCRVSSFRDGEAALSDFVANPNAYDLVITDQTMPGRTGIELARALLDIRRDIPIILCTGYSKSVDEDVALAAGIQGFLMKPVRKRELALLIRKVLQSSGDKNAKGAPPPLDR
jgi:CheY-like chemotaxis protein